MEAKLPYVPFGYAYRHENRTMRKSLNCATFPALQTLKFYNNFWQTYTVSNITFQLYGAYYDNRDDVDPGPVVRILAMVNQLKAPFPTSYCQIWYENEEIPEVVPISQYKAIWIWGGKNMFFPHLITCKPPKSAASGQIQRIPQAVSVAEHICDTPSNILNVVYGKPPESAAKLPFAVCVKGLDFPYIDISARLAEWLEIQRLLGAHKVYMYDIAIHPNVRKVLNFYQSEGFVEVRPITLVGGVVGIPYLQHWMLSLTKFNKRLNELIPYNDCFYRHMYEYEHIALVDVDEIIMPLGELRSWHDIVQVSVAYSTPKNCTHGFAALCFRNSYFPFKTDNFTITSTTELDDLDASVVPSHMFFLGHTYRASNYSRRGFAAKCLHRTSKVLTLHNHYPIEYMNTCRSLDVPTTVAHMQHYHDFQPDKEFNGLTKDYSIRRFEKPLIERTTRVLQKVGLLK